MTPARLRHSGVLFDFDGTLARTMEDHFAAWRDAFAESGIAIRAEDYFPLEGASLAEIARILARDRGNSVAIDLEEVVRRKKAIYSSAPRFEPYPGVVEILERLGAHGIPLAVVTASHRDQLERTTPRDFLRRFRAVLTGESFAKGKPDPEPYLRGAEALGLAPGECIAVENAPLGIRSAKAAGAYCIAIASTVAPSGLAGADAVIPDFLSLASEPRFLALLNDGMGAS